MLSNIIFVTVQSQIHFYYFSEPMSHAHQDVFEEICLGLKTLL